MAEGFFQFRERMTRRGDRSMPQTPEPARAGGDKPLTSTLSCRLPFVQFCAQENNYTDRLVCCQDRYYTKHVISPEPFAGALHGIRKGVSLAAAGG